MTIVKPLPIADHYPTKEPSIQWIGVFLVFLTPALGGFLYGFDIGATSFVLNSMLSPSSSHQQQSCWWNNSFYEWQQGLVVAAVSLGALAGSHVVLVYLSRTVSRRMELRVASVLYLLGITLNVASGTLFRADGLLILLTGRFLFGMGVGCVMHGAPTYMVEMTPTSVRGAIVSAKETVIVLGIVVGYGAGAWCVNHEIAWPWLYGAQTALAVPFAVLTYAVPRSFRWLLQQPSPSRYEQEARASLRFVYDQKDCVALEDMFEAMQQAASHDRKPESTSSSAIALFKTLMSPELIPACRAAFGLILFQQLSGQPSVISYSAIVFEEAGWNGNASIITALFMVCVSATTVLSVDHWGRQNLLATCCLVLMTAAWILAWQFNQRSWNEEDPEELDWVSRWTVLLAMFGFIGGYQIGFGPISWCIVSEVFPTDVRGPATALAVELNYLLNFLVQFLVPIAKEKIGWGPTFAVFGTLMGSAFVFVRNYIPETAGLSLEEIADHFIMEKSKDDASIRSDETSIATEDTPLLGSPSRSLSLPKETA